ncbi:hypothetical protein [Methanoculleus chikugoensis]|uniref:hypothetical protein n=1 Tax=Methanoculleus chikugoensis TaxID=118126 RepID=UPI001FB1ED27|nr:hypothetical protein [Methanoculleus chikugoensis]
MNVHTPPRHPPLFTRSTPASCSAASRGRPGAASRSTTSPPTPGSRGLPDAASPGST